MRFLLCFALLLGLLPARLHAEANACPASPSGLPDSIERGTFCVYYDDNNTTDAQATTVADHTQDYWDLYTSAAFGFLAPSFTNKLVVEILNSASCNGGTSPSSNDFNIFNGCFNSSAESVQQTVGHELFHRVQYSYHGNEVKWFKEGTARAMEDLAFTNIDQWPTTFMAPFSFNLQANEYLGNSNVDITSIPQRYNSALWWKYFTEQFGTVATEPQRGVDAMVSLWNAAITQDDIAALNSALSALGAGVNFDGAFRRFVAANYIKDLTNQPHATRYNYIDEDEAGSPGVYGPVVPTNGGTINNTTPANFNNQSISRYGARYYQATPSSTNCPVVSATFHTDSGPAFYHVVTQKGSALSSFSSSTGTDFAQAFFNDGLTRIVAIVGSTNNSAQADISLQCVNPTISIVMPNNVAIANVGPFDGPGKFLAQVQVTNGSPTGPVIAGLTSSDFKAKVNGVNALITGSGFVQEQYWLVVQAPVQGANGLYDLEISLEKSGTTDVIATDTNLDSVSYNDDNVDHLLVVDRSGSMSADGKMNAAKSAAKFYVDITRVNDGLAVIPYNENVNPAPFTLRAVTAAPNVRQQAKVYIDGLSASGLTSIGDGMREAVNERIATPTGNDVCSYVLMSDGMENSAEFWSTVEADAIATGCPVTSIAFGSAADETLMQNIAIATGGAYFYNDVFVSAASAGVDSPDAVDAAADTALGLGNVYEYAQARADARERVLAEKSVFGPTLSDVQTHTVMIDDSMSQALFAVDWVPQGIDLKATLIDPEGNVVRSHPTYDFYDSVAGHLGWRVDRPELISGEWQIVVAFNPIIIGSVPNAVPNTIDAPDQPGPTHYQVLVSGPSSLTVSLLLPAVQKFTGQRMPIHAIVSSATGPVPNLMPLALVTAPDGSVKRVRLYDDGSHDDGAAGDGFYGGFYTAVNQANAVQPSGEPGPQPPPNDEGSYIVKVLVEGADFQRESLGSFSVKEGKDDNNNNLPDPYEAENDVNSPNGDPDLDGLTTIEEYQLGTDPNNSDTDGGGENDGSEFEDGDDPFDPADDDIEAPEHLMATPDIGLNVINYDVKPEYTEMVLYRATSADGPWTPRVTELPNTGIYSDTADNGTTYFYRYMGIDAEGNRSAIIGTTPVTPSTDPFAPEAAVLIDGGAPTTPDLNVVLSFVPSSEEIEYFEDITQMKLSNDPTLSGASYQPFAQNVPWVLPPTPDGELAKVYAQFKDEMGNESLIVQGVIMVKSGTPQFDTNLYMPLIEGKAQ